MARDAGRGAERAVADVRRLFCLRARRWRTAGSGSGGGGGGGGGGVVVGTCPHSRSRARACARPSATTAVSRHLGGRPARARAAGRGKDGHGRRAPRRAAPLRHRAVRQRAGGAAVAGRAAARLHARGRAFRRGTHGAVPSGTQQPLLPMGRPTRTTRVHRMAPSCCWSIRRSTRWADSRAARPRWPIDCAHAAQTMSRCEGADDDAAAYARRRAPRSR